MATVTKGRTFVSGETVTPTKLNDLVDLATVTAIQTADISDSQVTTAKIADANVTAAKLASNAVETAKINNAAVTAAKLDGAQTGSAPIYGCRAWVNFDGTKDSTGAVSTANTNRLIRASGNVASVLRDGTGIYTITFTTAMPDANYSITATRSEGSSATARGSSGATIAFGTTPTASSLSIENRVGSTSGTDGAPDDPPTVCIQVFR